MISAPTKDLTGLKFGRLTVLHKCDWKDAKGSTVWACVCECGTMRYIRLSSLTSENTNSCGCYLKDRAVESHTTHGGFHDRLYGVWNMMIQRCTNPNNWKYNNYGGRGIKVCDQWRDYAVFRDWALKSGYDKDAPFSQCTIDRIDVDGNYCPENCRWADSKTQNMNKRKDKLKAQQSV